MAIVSLVALLVALALAALVSLRPWEVTPVGPQLTIAPGIGVALGDAVELSPSRRLNIADARPAAGRPPVLASDDRAGAMRGQTAAVGVSLAKPVAHSSRPARPVSPPEPPATAPPSSPQPVPAAVPVAVPPPAPAAAPPTPARPGYGNPPHRPSPAGGPTDVVQLSEGDEYAFSLAFFVWEPLDGMPVVERVIVQVEGEASEDPAFGLQIRDDGGGGLGVWSSGDAMDGERLLAPVAEGWHEAFVYLRASSEEDGFYLLLLDGEPIDARDEVSLIDPGSSYAEVELGPGVARLNDASSVLP